MTIVNETRKTDTAGAFFALLDTNGVEVNRLQHRFNFSFAHAFLAKLTLDESGLDGVAQLVALAEVGNVLRTENNLAIGEIAVRQPEKAVNLAIPDIMPQFVALGIRSVGADFDREAGSFRILRRPVLCVAANWRCDELLFDRLGKFPVVGDEHDAACDARPHIRQQRWNEDRRGHEDRHQQGHDDEGLRADALDVLALDDQPCVMHSAPPHR